MKKREIKAADYAEQIIKAIPKGVLVTTKGNDMVNSMTIGWGSYGTEWNAEVFVVYVRESRYTRELLDQNPEFTINIPMGEIDPAILKVCGSKSGRDMNKIEELGLTLVEPEEISVPGLLELPLTLECKVVLRQRQNVEVLDKKFERFYPEEIDAHIAYYGEIVKAYIAEEE